MSTNYDSDDDRLIGVVWRALVYVLWLPLGTRSRAVEELHELRATWSEFLADAREANGGKPIPRWALVKLAARELRHAAAIAFELVIKLGADSWWVYKLADPLMVFVVIPVLFLVAGAAVGGVLGVSFALALLVLIWLSLVDRLRRSMREGITAESSPEVDTVFTLPNVLTTARLACLWFFPALLAGGHPLRALSFFAAAVSTDWADGFIARHYGLRSRLGTMLDPATDRLLMVVVLVAMMGHGLLRPSLGFVVLGRELATIVVAVALLRPDTKAGRPKAEVHWTGKLGFAVSTGALAILMASPVLGSAVAIVADSLLLVGFVLNLYALVNYCLQALDRSRLPEDG